MATGAKQAQMKKKFAELDTDGNGQLDFNELSALLWKGNPSMPEADIHKLYKGCDTNGDGCVDFDEFMAYIYGASGAAPKKDRSTEGRHAALAAGAPSLDDGTEKDWASCAAVFEKFAGKDMDNKEFAKFCKDLKLVGHGMAKHDVDLIFTKVVTKGQRKIPFDQFKNALRHVARKRQQTNCEIQELMEKASGPVLTGTKAEYVEMYDNKENFTGTATQNANFEGSGSATAVGRHDRDKTSRAEELEALKASAGPWGDCEAVFAAFAGPGAEVDGREFLKMCTECKVVGKGFTKQDVDIIFASVGRGAKKLGFAGFQDCVIGIASKKGQAVSAVQSVFAENGKDGPIMTGATKTEYSRFHDDKSTYTGTKTCEGDHGADRHEKLHDEQAAREAAGGDELDWGDSLKVFNMFGGDNGVDPTEFTKMMTDAKIYDKNFTKNDVDIVFRQAAGDKAVRRLDTDMFMKAVRLVATRKKCGIATVQEAIGASEGPSNTGGTKVIGSRFADAENFTGTAAN